MKFQKPCSYMYFIRTFLRNLYSITVNHWFNTPGQKRFLTYLKNFQVKYPPNKRLCYIILQGNLF